MKNNKNTTVIILFLLFFIILLSFTAYKIKNYGQTENSEKTLGYVVDSTPLLNPTKETKIYFVGDIMLDRGVLNSVNKNFNGDFSLLFENVTELEKADILFGNLEGPVSDKGNNVGSKYSFRMSPEVLPILKNVGFNIFSFANNHVGDWNVQAFNDTLKRLKEQEIFVTGAGENKKEASSPTVIVKNDVRFGFLGFSDVGPDWMKAKEFSSGILLASDPDFESIIINAKQDSDVLIVSVHFGEEYKEVHNKRQEYLAKKAIDSGADMVIGHHPHVIEDIEFYKEKPIVYSLGNFMFDQYFSAETMEGMVLMTTFEGKNLKELKSLKSVQNNKYQIEGLYEETIIERTGNTTL